MAISRGPSSEPSFRISATVLQQLTRRYRLALGLVALASVAAYGGLHYLSAFERYEAPIRSAVSRQELLAQQTTLLALRAMRTESRAERESLSSQLRGARDLLEAAQHGLRYGDPEQGLPGHPSEMIRRLYDEAPTHLSLRVDHHVRAIDAFLTRPEAPPAEVIGYFHSEQPTQLLTMLMALAGAHEAEGAARGRTVERVETLLLMLTLILLALEALLVFEPMVVRLGLQIARAEAERSNAVEREARLREVLAATDDALILVSPEGRVEPGWSTQAESWFPQIRARRLISDLLFVARSDRELFMLTFEQLRGGLLPDELAIEQMPSRARVGQREFALSYRPVREGRSKGSVLLVIRDITARLERDEANRRAVELQTIITHLIRDRHGFTASMSEARECFDELEKRTPETRVLLRELHTLKGNLSMLGFRAVSERIHVLEGDAGILPAHEVDARLRELGSMWRDAIQEIEGLIGAQRENMIGIYPPEYDALLSRVDDGIGQHELVTMLRRWRFEPVRPQLERLAYQAERVAAALGKEVEVVVDDPFVRFDMARVKGLWSALGHIVRNAVDHGIEPAELREQRGKARCARLTLSCRRAASRIELRIADDGGGVDVAKLREKASAMGLGAELPLEDLLFADGLSSRASSSEFSGRGVGLPAVREVVQALGATLEVETRVEVGTAFVVGIPEELVMTGAEMARSASDISLVRPLPSTLGEHLNRVVVGERR